MQRKCNILLFFCAWQIALSTYSFLFAEIVSYNNHRSNTGQQLQEKLAEMGHHVGYRMIDVLCIRDKNGKYRETHLVNMLLYIKTTLWKTLFGKEADNLEQSTESEGTCICCDRSEFIW
jgi:hypothetical protein